MTNDPRYQFSDPPEGAVRLGCSSPLEFAEGDGGYTPPEWIQILPLGYIYHPMGDIDVTDEFLTLMIDNFENRFKNEILVDYFHQRADAAGWIDRLEIRRTDDPNTSGLYGHIREWDEDAAAKLKAKKLRYTSADFFREYRDPRTGKDVGPKLVAVALTNTPYIDGMEPVAASIGKAKRGSTHMLEQLRKLLGLAKDATEEQILEAAKQLQALLGTVRKALGLADDADGAAIEAGVKQLNERPAHPELAKIFSLGEDADLNKWRETYFSLTGSGGDETAQQLAAMAKEIKDLTTRLGEKDARDREAEADGFASHLLAERKITPAQVATAKAWYLSDPEKARQHFSVSPDVVPTFNLPPGPSGGNGGSQARTLYAEEAGIFKSAGITEAELVALEEKKAAATK